MIDGGVESCGKKYETILTYIEKNNEKVDAIILTHVDNDHIQGALDGLGRMSAESLGQVEEKNLSEKLVSCTISGDIVELSGGAKLRVISPGEEQLKNLLDKWDEYISKHNRAAYATRFGA